MKITLTKHARDKFGVLKKHSFTVSEKQVLSAVQSPDIVDLISRKPLFIAQKRIDATHVLSVIYKQEGGVRKIITFYPGRTSQYGQTK